MNLKKPSDILLILGGSFLALGLVLGIGGWINVMNIFAQVGVQETPPGYVQRGINLMLIGTWVGMPMVLFGILLMVASLIVHFTTKSKPQASS